LDLHTSEPFRAGSIAWQEHPGQWTLTVVCKATYALAAEKCPLAREQEDIAESDNHWDDDPQRSLYAPSDLAPYKLRPEVMLVGSAFARRGQQVRSLFVRMIVAGIDKSIEVFAPRNWLSDGTLQEGARWSHMQLRYERAAGAGETWNPVGVDPGAIDPYGRRAMPNLQPPGLQASQPGCVIPPVGFGPIAATWRVRRDKLGHRAASWRDRGWNEAPLGAGFDMSFFQAAPLDQRVEELRPDEPFVLENLHPEHPRLVTSLPGVRPRARVEMADQPAWELQLIADTLWIDTNRALCTLTWRGRIPLERRDQRGSVRIVAEEPGRPVQWPAMDAPPSTSPRRSMPAAPPRPPPPAPSQPVESISVIELFAVEEEAAMTGAIHVSAEKPVLPFAPDTAPPSQALGTRSLPFVPAQPAPPPPPRPPLPSGTWSPDDTGTMSVMDVMAHIPVPFRGQGAPASPPVAEPPPPPPPVAALPPPVAAPPQPSFIAQQAPTFAAAAAPSFVTPPSFVPRADVPSTGYAGVLEASNAATSGAPEEPARAEAAPAVSFAARSLIELIWFDPIRAPFLARQSPAWAEHLGAPVDLPPDDPRAPEEWAKLDRADVAAVLSKAQPTGDVQGAVSDSASEDGLLDAPVLMAAGELELSFDEVETLKVVLAAATPLAGADKKLKETVDLAAEVQKSPFGGLPDVAAGWTARIREAWTKAANRTLPADYLDTHAKHLLLEQRKYVRRDLCNETWLRAQLSMPGAPAPVPLYLPEAIAKWLPLFNRFPARVLAEAVPQQDQFETQPVALRAMALARVLPARGRR
jgi:hypothetical protein